MRIVKRKHSETRQAIQVQNFFKTANFVAAEVQIVELNELVEACFDRVDLIASKPELLELRQPFQVVYSLNTRKFQAKISNFNLDLVLAQPKHFQLAEVLKPVDLGDGVVVNIQLFERSAV